ncbi:Arylsulfatase A [Rubritalea squalenifaciens DSM 18772]|uniref:Arylsulfatase A n=1 Tax=Rubritalea squalenifaciens DSM 18772 TaxID=1123071 RepID=A0A1M6IS88_9BACT|nr:sulfatase-like hydrolase/transferase [Rubritalea squalenifaciens]SHJ37322.1 Arylsulfatase A [Rubritalea squalenifaciens DSM 18772]
MFRRLYLILAVTFLGLPMIAQAEEPEKKRPNILFLITDDQFKHHMNWMPEGKGKNLTPHTDALAAQATILDQQYVTSPVCTPSRFSSLTGLYPSRSKAEAFLSRQNELGGQTSVEWNTFITEGMPTLPKLLQKSGYRTGIVGKNHVVEVKGMEKPKWLAKADDPEMLAVLKRNNEKQIKAIHEAGFDYGASLYYDNPDFIGVKALASHNLDWIAKGALDFLDSEDDRPFFLYCAVTIPHGPGEESRSWNADPRITAEGMLDKPLNVMPARETIPARLREAGIKDNSRANLLWLDDMVGTLVKKLEQTGELENTVILYFNDHGQKAKGTIYQGGVHSEAFISRPGGFPVGSRTKVKVSNIDFAPTLLDIAGADYADVDFDGVSFLPLLENKTTDVHDALFFELGFVRGIIKGDYKYIALRYPASIENMPLAKRKRILERFNNNQKRRERPVYTTDPTTPFSHVQTIPGGGDAEHMSIDKYPAFHDKDQLYNLANDPNEQKNLAKDPEHAAKLAEMKQLLSDHLKKMPGSFGEFTAE